MHDKIVTIQLQILFKIQQETHQKDVKVHKAPRADPRGEREVSWSQRTIKI